MSSHTLSPTTTSENNSPEKKDGPLKTPVRILNDNSKRDWNGGNGIRNVSDYDDNYNVHGRGRGDTHTEKIRPSSRLDIDPPHMRVNVTHVIEEQTWDGDEDSYSRSNSFSSYDEVISLLSNSRSARRTRSESRSRRTRSESRSRRTQSVSPSQRTWSESPC